MIQCKERDCDREFETERGASVHHTISHKEVSKIECKYSCCGKTKMKYPSEIKNHYEKELKNDTKNVKLPCCKECQKDGGVNGANWQGGKVKIECSNCSSIVEMWPCREERIDNCFCEDCRTDWYRNNFVGEKHPKYKDNSIRQTTYYGEDWIEIREKVRERDGNICQECGKGEEEIGRKPSVHHITPVRDFYNNNDANSLNNLVQLCPLLPS